MKKAIIMIAVFTALFLTACDKEKMPDIASISGEYKGYTTTSCTYFQDVVEENVTIVVGDNGNGTANVKYESESYGIFNIASVTVTEEGGTFTLSGQGKASMGMGGNVSEYDCSFTGVIENDKQAKMQFKVPAVMGGLVIDFNNSENQKE